VALANTPGRKFYSKDADPFPDQFSSFKHPKSGKQVRFINYLRLVAPSLDWQYDKATRDAYMKSPPNSDERDRIMQDGYMRNLSDFFERHKSMIVSACRGTRGAVREKYEFLAQYHNTESAHNTGSAGHHLVERKQETRRRHRSQMKSRSVEGLFQHPRGVITH